MHMVGIDLGHKGISTRNCRSHSASFPALSKAINSDSIMERAMQVCLKDFQNTIAPSRVKMYSLIDFDSLKSAIQFASLYPSSMWILLISQGILFAATAFSSSPTILTPPLSTCATRQPPPTPIQLEEDGMKIVRLTGRPDHRLARFTGDLLLHGPLSSCDGCRSYVARVGARQNPRSNRFFMKHKKRVGVILDERRWFLAGSHLVLLAFHPELYVIFLRFDGKLLSYHYFGSATPPCCAQDLDLLAS